jgi:hypothetical protein
MMGISWTFIRGHNHWNTQVHLHEEYDDEKYKAIEQSLDPSESGLGGFMTIDLAGHIDLIPSFGKASSLGG